MFEPPKKKIKIDWITRKDNKYELLVRNDISQSSMASQTLHQFEMAFEQAIKRHKKLTIASVSSCYKLLYTENHKVIEIWHLNVKGDKDRLLCKLYSIDLT